MIDYQNLHLTGHGLFAATRALPKHETVIDPLMFAQTLIQVRNAMQRAGHPAAELARVEVFRGLPSERHDPAGYARNQAQRAQWQRDPRVRVQLRPLKYYYERDASGSFVTDASGNRKIVDGPREKGVDVLCALAVVRAAREPAIDLVIVASADSDLAPALDEARASGAAKIETCSWYDAGTKQGQQLHPTDRSRPVWNTRLDETAFRKCWDPTAYR